MKLDSILFADPKEGCESLTATKGGIPSDISGVYYLNGPAKFRDAQHWLDGDGLIRALRIKNGKAELTTRFVRTKKYSCEAESDERIFRCFGTAFAGDQLRRRIALESPANVSVYPFGQQLLAFGEQAPPWELDPITLETIAECRFGGKLVEISPFSAHPKFDSDRGRLCNFGMKYFKAQTRLCYWEFDETHECQIELQVDPGRPYSVHDYALSKNYATFYLSPYYLDSNHFISGRSIHEALDWQPEDGNELYILPRDGSKPIHISLGQRGYCLHLIQSLEADNHLVVDVIETEEPLYPQYIPLPNLFATVKPCRFTRVKLDTRTWKVVELVSTPLEVHLDFPCVAGNSVWSLGMPVEPLGEPKYYNQILRFNLDSREITEKYQASNNCYIAGEPALAGDYLICPQWCASENQSSYLIFDVFDLSCGPLAVLPLSYPSPLGFHSSFSTCH